MKLPPSTADHWMLTRGRFSWEPVNYKILQCALPTKSWAVSFNCSSSFIFCSISCYTFMMFKINYKICHLRTYILVRDINTSILYSWTFSPIFILVKESRTKTMTHGRESFHKRDLKKTKVLIPFIIIACLLDYCLQEARHRAQCSEHWWQDSHSYRTGDTESSLPGWRGCLWREVCF